MLLLQKAHGRLLQLDALILSRLSRKLVSISLVWGMQRKKWKKNQSIPPQQQQIQDHGRQQKRQRTKWPKIQKIKMKLYFFINIYTKYKKISLLMKYNRVLDKKNKWTNKSLMNIRSMFMLSILQNCFRFRYAEDADMVKYSMWMVTQKYQT